VRGERTARVVAAVAVTGLLAAGVVAATSAPAAAANLNVDDPVDGAANGPDCTDLTAGNCSIRDAFAAATTAGGDTINLGSAVLYHLTLGHLNHSADQPLTIEGNGATIDQDTVGARVINKTQNNLTLRNVTVTGGNQSTASAGFNLGGGVLNFFGPVTLEDSAVTGNTAVDNGGGISSAGVTLLRSSVSGNTAGGNGGGIQIHNNGAVHLTDSSVNNNDAAGGRAGGIGADGSASVTITRSTIAGNDATIIGGGVGGGIVVDTGTPTVVSSTFSGNTPVGISNINTIKLISSTVVDNGAYNISGGGGRIVSGTIFAGAATKNCFGGTTITRGYNYEQDTNWCALTALTDTINGADAQLGPLQDNGGLTLTRIGAPTSPTANAIPDANCDDGDADAGMTTTVDQRSLPRPAVATLGCDIGSVDAPQRPGPPTGVSATPADSSVQVSYVVPTYVGDAPLLDSTVTCTPTGAGAPMSVTQPSPVTLAPLVNGTTYSCVATSRNTYGSGPPSAAVLVTPRTTPGPPRSVSTSPSGSGGARVYFLPPTSNGGAAVTSYKATCSASGKPNRSATGPASSLLVTTMFNGTTYGCVVTAMNAAGSGPPSAASYVRIGSPSAPLAVSVVKGSTAGSLKVSWAAAAQNAAPITTYIVTCTPKSGSSKTVFDSASPAAVTGLVRTKSYLCRVYARNKYGTGKPRYATKYVVPT
jgi:hypothetical protein